MSAPVDHQLHNAWEGALAGGGDPASSPLYVFGPFLALIVGAGVADITFGASIWLAVITIAVVALLYRLVMRWVVDGSGGTGLSEEELGPWAAKASAAITCVEYTLTFLVSIAALVTFVADRLSLDGDIFGVSERTWLAIGTSIACGWLVNRGPRLVSRVFGPATAAVLALLWIMTIATLAQRGLQLAPLHLDAFRGENLHYTLGGFVRILALMTGIEVFANLVAAYTGSAEQRSRTAFRSLALIMGSTALTMVVVGPAILALTDPADPNVSVFTQAMDALLPYPIALAGTAVSVLVLLSAAAASALGIQSLFLGLSVRHYAPAAFSHRNRAGVASRPVWSEVGAACACFIVFGTHEATYLAVYAAGVFVLLSMTGWAAMLRLIRQHRAGIRTTIVTRAGVLLAALFTTLATIVIFVERFADGVWLYFILIPAIAFGFGLVRRIRGDPGATADRIGRLLAQWNRGERSVLALAGAVAPDELDHVLAAIDNERTDASNHAIAPGHAVFHAAPGAHDGPRQEASWRVSVPLDGSAHAERALRYVIGIATQRALELVLIHVHEHGDEQRAREYLALVATAMEPHASAVTTHVRRGEPAVAIREHAVEHSVALVVMSTHGRSGLRRALAGSVAMAVVETRPCSVLTVPIHAV
jgi:nucleotide-binding universal stress UspA family protein